MNVNNYQKTCAYICIALSSLYMLMMLAMTDAKPFGEAVVTVIFILLGIGAMAVMSMSMACIVMDRISKKNFMTCAIVSTLSTCLTGLLFEYVT